MRIRKGRKTLGIWKPWLHVFLKGTVSLSEKMDQVVSHHYGTGLIVLQIHVRP